ncbi:hypothetical protein DFH09DRAFT_1107742 [Mycena vulgaris]|nr:hypothetical protein DFH09DRAFT_1107742 [Mycena vulgaris]
MDGVGQGWDSLPAKRSGTESTWRAILIKAAEDEDPVEQRQAASVNIKDRSALWNVATLEDRRRWWETDRVCPWRASNEIRKKVGDNGFLARYYSGRPMLVNSAAHSRSHRNPDGFSPEQVEQLRRRNGFRPTKSKSILIAHLKNKMFEWRCTFQDAHSCGASVGRQSRVLQQEVREDVQRKGMMTKEMQSKVSSRRTKGHVGKNEDDLFNTKWPLKNQVAPEPTMSFSSLAHIPAYRAALGPRCKDGIDEMRRTHPIGKGGPSPETRHTLPHPWHCVCQARHMGRI